MSNCCVDGKLGQIFKRFRSMLMIIHTSLKFDSEPQCDLQASALCQRAIILYSFYVVPFVSDWHLS